MRISILLLIVSTLFTGCYAHHAHRTRSYKACAGCDGFEAPVMTGPNRKEVRELRNWYRQLNREETLASRNRRSGRTTGGCQCCHSDMIGMDCESNMCHSGMCEGEVYGDAGYPEMAYNDGYIDEGYSNDGWMPTEEGNYPSDGLVYEGDSMGEYCPHCQQRQQVEQYDSQMISPEVAPTPSLSPGQEASPVPAPAATGIDTTYLPEDYYSPQPSSVPAQLPSPVLEQAQPVSQTLWAPTKHGARGDVGLRSPE